LGYPAPTALPQRPNRHWSLDFVSDRLTNGRRFRILVVVDYFAREFGVWLPTRRCLAHGRPVS
jgi:putative transposase